LLRYAATIWWLVNNKDGVLDAGTTFSEEKSHVGRPILFPPWHFPLTFFSSNLPTELKHLLTMHGQEEATSRPL
jgi:hypothetical protein